VVIAAPGKYTARLHSKSNKIAASRLNTLKEVQCSGGRVARRGWGDATLAIASFPSQSIAASRRNGHASLARSPDFPTFVRFVCEALRHLISDLRPLTSVP
jgi:hypothetical protein